MEITISDEHLAHISKLVDSGRYPSADAVIARALALLEERDLADSDPAIAAELAEVRAKVMQGIDDLKHGRYTVYSKETRHLLVEDVKRRGRELLETEKARKEAFVG